MSRKQRKLINTTNSEETTAKIINYKIIDNFPIVYKAELDKNANTNSRNLKLQEPAVSLTAPGSYCHVTLAALIIG